MGSVSAIRPRPAPGPVKEAPRPSAGRQGPFAGGGAADGLDEALCDLSYRLPQGRAGDTGGALDPDSLARHERAARTPHCLTHPSAPSPMDRGRPEQGEVTRPRCADRRAPHQRGAVSAGPRGARSGAEPWRCRGCVELWRTRYGPTMGTSVSSSSPHPAPAVAPCGSSNLTVLDAPVGLPALVVPAPPRRERLGSCRPLSLSNSL